MSQILTTMKGSVAGRGFVTTEGRYVVYEYLEINVDDNLVRLSSVAMSKDMAVDLKDGIAFQFADATKFNGYFNHQFLCGMQKKNGDILVDSKILKATYKTRYFLACLSLIPPFTVVAPFVFKKAGRLKAACEQLGLFEPVEPNFIKKINKKLV